MLALIYGTDTQKKKEAREKILAKHGMVNSTLSVRTGAALDIAEIQQAALGASLFGETIAYVLEYPF